MAQQVPGQLKALRQPLDCLIDEMQGHGRFLRHLQPQQRQQAADTSSSTASSSSSSSGGVVDRASAVQQQVDGAVRNMLTALGVPLMCAAGATEVDRSNEASALVEFAMRYHYALFQVRPRGC